MKTKENVNLIIIEEFKLETEVLKAKKEKCDKLYNKLSKKRIELITTLNQLREDLYKNGIVAYNKNNEQFSDLVNSIKELEDSQYDLLILGSTLELEIQQKTKTYERLKDYNE